MTTERVERRLTVIVSADVVGYSRLIRADEAGTRAALNGCRQDVIDPELDEHQGRLVSTAGDSLLAEFTSVVDAVQWAADVQHAMAERNAGIFEDRRVVFRIGINLGDVIVEGDDIHGDGVNIAARLQSIAHPGGICISANVFEQVQHRMEMGFEDLGDQQVKNIAQPIRAYHWRPDAGATKRAEPATSDQPGRESATFPRQEKKPALLLLPFESLGGNEQARVLTAGLTEQTAFSLANLPGISLVTTADDADYVMKGSVQTLGSRVRATVQLLDQRSHERYWSDRFDGVLEDMFETLDDLVLQISTALRYHIHEREAERSKDRPVEQLSNEEMIGLAGQILLRSKRADYERSVALINRVLDSDPDNFTALAIRAWGAMVELQCGYGKISPEDGALGLELAERAVALNERSEFVHMVLGNIQLFYEHDNSAAIREAERSLELNPNYALALGLLGRAMIFDGQVETGLAHCVRAVEANPRFGANHWILEDMALGHFLQEDYSAALNWSRRADQRERDVPKCLLMLITASWHARELDTARKYANRLVDTCPEFRICDIRQWPFRDPEHWGRFTRGLIGASLPE